MSGKKMSGKEKGMKDEERGSVDKQNGCFCLKAGS